MQAVCPDLFPPGPDPPTRADLLRRQHHAEHGFRNRQEERPRDQSDRRREIARAPLLFLGRPSLSRSERVQKALRGSRLLSTLGLRLQGETQSFGEPATSPRAPTRKPSLAVRRSQESRARWEAVACVECLWITSAGPSGRVPSRPNPTGKTLGTRIKPEPHARRPCSTHVHARRELVSPKRVGPAQLCAGPTD